MTEQKVTHPKKWTKEDHKNAIKNLEFVKPNLPTDKKPDPFMNELEILALFCDNFNLFDEDAKKRVINYLHSRYYSYFGYASIKST